MHTTACNYGNQGSSIDGRGAARISILCRRVLQHNDLHGKIPVLGRRTHSREKQDVRYFSQHFCCKTDSPISAIRIHQLLTNIWTGVTVWHVNSRRKNQQKSGLIKWVKSMAIRWAFHAARVGETRNACTLLTKPEDIRPLRRLRAHTRWQHYNGSYINRIRGSALLAWSGSESAPMAGASEHGNELRFHKSGEPSE
jgi:hypothetical protein